MKEEVSEQLYKISEELEIAAQRELTEIFHDLSEYWKDEYEQAYFLRGDELRKRLLDTAAQLQNAAYEMRWMTGEDEKNDRR